jgi:hypothetical protein
MSDPKTINTGRMIIHPDVRPTPPVAGSHISEHVREALKDQSPEIANGVRRVADSK